MSSALWWVTNGRAGRAAELVLEHRRLDLDEAARSSELARIAATAAKRTSNTRRASSFTMRST